MQNLLILAVVVAASCSLVNCDIYNSWLTDSCVGYNDYTGNVLSVTNGSNVVAVRSNSIPCYTIGPTWDINPSKPIAANTTTYFPMSPEPETGTKTDVCLGIIGLFIDGVFIFNYWDADQRDAYVYEGPSFDSCWGHPNPTGYHIHVAPICLMEQLGYSLNDTSQHSPLLGFMLDSYPVYGPVGYSDPTDSSSSLKFLTSSYSNYVYNSANGDLDEHNGRWTVTPEYPEGTYAYYATYSTYIASNGSLIATPTYPYLIGPKYYGKVSSYVRDNCDNNGVVNANGTVTTRRPSPNPSSSRRSSMTTKRASSTRKVTTKKQTTRRRTTTRRPASTRRPTTRRQGGK